MNNKNIILQIDTRIAHCSVIVLSIGEEVYRKESKNFGSQTLLPLILAVLKEKKLQFSDVTEIRIELGHGSFTGLRVGAAVGNILGRLLNIPVNGSHELVLPHLHTQ